MEKIIANITHYPHPDIPLDQQYIGSLEPLAIVVSGGSEPDVWAEMMKSLELWIAYNSSLTYQQLSSNNRSPITIENIHEANLSEPAMADPDKNSIAAQAMIRAGRILLLTIRDLEIQYGLKSLIIDRDSNEHYELSIKKVPSRDVR